MKKVNNKKGNIKELVKPSQDLEMDYGMVQAYCETRDSCRRGNKSMDSEEDILF